MYDHIALWGAELKRLAKAGLAGNSGDYYQRIYEIGERMENLSLSMANGVRNQRDLFKAIINKLAQKYFKIYYVNILTDDYYILDPHKPDRAFVDRKDDFFLKKNAFKFDTLCEEDSESFRTSFQKDKLIDAIRNDGSFSIVYRVKDKDNFVFVNMEGTQLDGDPNHIIIGVRKADSWVKREWKYIQNVSNAYLEANQDSLTGVKNKHAYIDYEAELNRQIEEKDIDGFAIAVFDVNGLKTINDTLGHKAGDRCIKESCSLICDTFKRSPVFRIGGDEFAVIAKDNDYRHIDHLMDQFTYISKQNRERGGIVVAAGMAKYQGESKVSDVFKRADDAMHANKKELKEGK